MTKHTILLLAANPQGADLRELDREARAIQLELERSAHRDRFEFVPRRAVEPLDLLRELRKLRPTVVHFSGRGGHLAPSGITPTGHLAATWTASTTATGKNPAMDRPQLAVRDGVDAEQLVLAADRVRRHGRRRH